MARLRLVLVVDEAAYQLKSCGRHQIVILHVLCINDI